MIKQRAKNIFHHVENRDPLYTDIPPFIPFIWLNGETGQLFSCVKNVATGATWMGKDGIVSEPPIV